MRPIQEWMTKALVDAGLWDEFRKQMLFGKWSEIVGPTLSRHSHISQFKDGQLTVVAKYAPVMQELMMLSPQIKERMNQIYGSTLITKLRVVTGASRKAVANPWKDTYEVRRVPVEKIVLQKQTVTAIDRTLESVSDEALKKELRQLAIGIAKRQYYRRKTNARTCPECRNPLFEGETLCLTCRLRHHREKIGRLKAILVKQPHLRLEEVSSLEPCTMEELLEAKRENLQYYMNQLYCEHPSEHLRNLVAMLMTGKTHTSLSKARIKALTDPYTMAGKKAQWEQAKKAKSENVYTKK